jgi:hypothetical protein
MPPRSSSPSDGHAVDPFTCLGCAGIEGEDSYPEFSAYLERYKVRDRVTVHRGLSADVLPTLDGSFGLAFIDGSHDAASVHHNLELMLRLLVSGSWLAFHDYGRDVWPDVAVDGWRANGISSGSIVWAWCLL